MLAAHDGGCARENAEIIPRSLRPGDIHAAKDCLLAGTVTPILYGQPWLEKPALYYWRAMGFFREFGVSDWSARLPSISAAAFLVLLIFLHMRRFRPGGHLDAALITVSSLAILGFSRGASTDMQLAAPFCIGMLGWYAWYETGKKFWLFDLYFFGAAATLAKGPVAPLPRAAHHLSLYRPPPRVVAPPPHHLASRRPPLPADGSALVHRRPAPQPQPSTASSSSSTTSSASPPTSTCTTSPPGTTSRSSSSASCPGPSSASAPLVDAFNISIAEWKVRGKRIRYLGHSRAGDAFPEFLVLWGLIPVLFFSFSGSKLPGYILPSIPPLTILTGDYLYRVRRNGLRPSLLYAHAILSAAMVFVLILAPQHMKYETLVPSRAWLALAGVSALLTAALIVVVVRRFGLRELRNATLVPVIAMLIFLLGFHGRDLDLNYSARPLAQEIARLAPNEHTVALFHVKRDMDYGLAFYRNQRPAHYELDGVPPEEHVLVFRTTDQPTVDQILTGRIYEPLFLYDTQGLSVYKVYPLTLTSTSTLHPPTGN